MNIELPLKKHALYNSNLKRKFSFQFVSFIACFIKVQAYRKFSNFDMQGFVKTTNFSYDVIVP